MPFATLEFAQSSNSEEPGSQAPPFPTIEQLLSNPVAIDDQFSNMPAANCFLFSILGHK
jgi:hypothetical protein